MLSNSIEVREDQVPSALSMRWIGGTNTLDPERDEITEVGLRSIKSCAKKIWRELWEIAECEK